jgi:hypothetical protein
VADQSISPHAIIGDIKKAQRYKGSRILLSLPVQLYVTEENRIGSMVFPKYSGEMFLKIAELEKMTCQLLL